MSHDKLKAAARRRMAQTGEPYAVARRAVIKEHEAVQLQQQFAAQLAELGSARRFQQQLAEIAGVGRFQQQLAAQLAELGSAFRVPLRFVPDESSDEER
jgi:hypothetical protein